MQISSDHILEVAIFVTKPGMQPQFEVAIREVGDILRTADGYISHTVRKCIESGTRYALLVAWRSVADHTETFRNSPAAARCRELVRDYLDTGGSVEHYAPV